MFSSEILLLLLLFVGVHSIGSPSLQVFKSFSPEKLFKWSLEKLSRLFFERVSVVSLRYICSLEAMPTVKHYHQFFYILTTLVVFFFFFFTFWTFKQTRLENCLENLKVNTHASFVELHLTWMLAHYLLCAHIQVEILCVRNDFSGLFQCDFLFLLLLNK